jgi:hypothetical protein
MDARVKPAHDSRENPLDFSAYSSSPAAMLLVRARPSR